jgi:hypothetical protein
MQRLHLLCALGLACFLSVNQPAIGGTIVYFDQPESAKLLERAEAKGNFWPLVRYFISERIDTYCGIASSVMVLNALGVPSPVARYTYPYNKFDEENYFTPGVLDVQQVHNVAGSGQTLAQVASMLRTFDVVVDLHYADTISLKQFRALISAALATRDHFVIVNFARARLGQEGVGHISPLAAYDRKSDRFLMLDVARYKYAPSWVTAEDLWNAVNTDDSLAKKKRGLVIVSRK